jgi:TolB-like protein/Tfp pilus assembly protein PilF
MSLFNELKRRNVIRVGVAYAVAAWVLLQVVDLVFEYITAPDWIMQIFMLALAIGFPLVLILAWVFELTPEGIKLEAAIDPAQSVAPQTGRKLDRVIIVFLVLAVALLLADRFRTQKETGSITSEVTLASEGAETGQLNLTPVADSPVQNDKSIAVLPLVNRSVNAEDAFFAEGLHDELLTQLSRISALKVISRTSVMGYAGTTKRMPEIGRELGVATLLEGGVQRSGNRVRINVQLIDAATDEHLWAEVYDRELTADNLFDIQSNITQAIADALHAVLTGEEQQSLEQKSTDNVEAYAWYLRGKAASKGYGRLPNDIDKTIAFFQSAIDLDPQFAAAYAELAIDWTERFWVSDRLGNELQDAYDALGQAKTLAPELPETLTAEGYYHYWGHLDYTSAIAAFDRALQREPGNYLALRGKAYALRRLGRLDESIAALKTAVSLDPLYAEIHADLSYTLLRSGQYDQANVMLNRAAALGADNPFYQYVLAESHLLRGELEQAWQTIASASADIQVIQGFYLDIQLVVARAQANSARVDQVLESYLLKDAQSLGPIFSHGLVYLRRDERDKLNALIEDLQKSLQTAEREKPDAEATLLGFVQLYALQKDQAKLAGAVKAYYVGVKPDALRIIENRTIPIAYAISGDSEALLAYLDDLVAQFGPWEFYYFAIDPSFDNMRDLPRFQAHDKQYRQWLEQLP